MDLFKPDAAERIKKSVHDLLEKMFLESLEHNLVYFISSINEYNAITNQREPSDEHKRLQNILYSFLFNERVISKLSPIIPFSR